MIYVGNSLKDAISNTARCLHVIHQEISAPNMQGLFKIQPRDHKSMKIQMKTLKMKLTESYIFIYFNTDNNDNITMILKLIA